MYIRHFNLMTVPFDRNIDVGALYESSQFSEAVARLLYSCQKRSIAVLTGEVGAGKSTVLRMLESKLGSTNYLFIYIADSQLNSRNFYSTVLLHMGIQPPAQLPKLKRAFRIAVDDSYQSKGKTCVIVIDEAQTLELSMIQEVRFVMNFGIDSYSPLALVLAGQTEFRTNLITSFMAPIRRRVDTFYHITGMDLKETKDYIAHQLEKAGANHPLFPDDVIARVHEYSKGIADRINTLCKGCLLDAATRNQKLVDSENLERVLRELL